MAETSLTAAPANVILAGTEPKLDGNPFSRMSWAPPALRKVTKDQFLTFGFGAGAFVAALALYATIQASPMVSLYEGLAEADKAAVAANLEATGVSYELDAATGAIKVPQEDLHRARMSLASEGLPAAAPTGDSMLSNLPLGASRGIETRTLTGAREVDLARTIEAMDGVESARVHLALEEPSAFVNDAAPSSASVMITLKSGRSLGPEQIDSVRHLIASSVPGMQLTNVSVVDQRGNLLSSQLSDSQLENLRMQKEVEERYRQALTRLLVPMVGADGFSLELNVELDYTESQATRERYPKDESMLRQEQSNVRQLPGAMAPGGIPGAFTNQPPPAAELATNDPGAGGAAAMAGAPGSEEAFTRSYDLGREISITHKPTGIVQRISVSVALRNSNKKQMTQREIAKIERLVQGAIGFNAERGDLIQIESTSFTDVIEEPIPAWEEPWFMPTVKQILAILLALVVLVIFGWKLLKRKKAEPKTAEDTPLLNDDAINTQDLMDGMESFDESQEQKGRITIEMIEAAPTREIRNELVRHFVRQDKPLASEVVRDLIKEKSDAR